MEGRTNSNFDPNGSSGLDMELLWTNPSPQSGSGFADTYTVSALAGKTPVAYIVECGSSNSYAMKSSVNSTRNFVPVGVSNQVIVGGQTMDSDTRYVITDTNAYRRATATTSGITITKGYGSNQYMCIPWRVYAVY